MSSREGGYRRNNDGNNAGGQMKRKPRKKVCQFCQEKATSIDYKETGKLKSTFLKEVRYYQEELQELVLSTKEW